MGECKIPPPRRADLLIRALGDDGQHVVKDLRAGAYFNLPAQEAFLLQQLDGQQSDAAICAAFGRRFGQALTPAELDQFIELARFQGLLDTSGTADSKAAVISAVSRPSSLTNFARNILYWRVSFFDPNRLFNWLEPRLRFVWTGAFFWTTLLLIVLAAWQFWMHWAEFKDYFFESLRWETLVVAWLIIFAVTTCHEFSHGLTCKHYGGEVHEVGFLLMFFMPCFYCNVSDAWLIREKSKRLWVTMAGGYCDLVCWALATFLWRASLPYSFPYHCAWIVMSVCGGRVFLNFNPLVKLDGYYLVSDWLEIPNLRKRALDHVASRLRWLLWGAPRPAADPRGKVLFGFGLASWCFSVFYVSLMFYAFYHLLLASWGVFGLVILGLLAWLIVPGLLAGLFQGEVMSMLRCRPIRVAFWLVLLAGMPTALAYVPMDHWVSSTFKLRPQAHAEVRARVSGFLTAVNFDEGQRLSAGAALAIMEIPDLSARLAQKHAEIREVEAKLKLLQTGTRPEEIAEQKGKVERAKEWCTLAKTDLARKKKALEDEVVRLDEQISQATIQVDFAQEAYERARKLYEKKSLPLDQYQDLEKAYLTGKALHTQALAQKRERLVVGALEQEAELARREKECQDAVATLRLLEAGARPEELDAERARLSRLIEEKYYLDACEVKLRLVAPISGVIVTPHLHEKIGQYFKEGDLICEIEEPNVLEVEIPLEEQDIGRVERGFPVELKPRAQPFHTVATEVERIAPQAVAGKAQSTVNVYCTLATDDVALRSAMTGYARISCGQSSVLGVAWYRVHRYFRTEFWW
jgi:putative peptide zinc metalloprotease protein